MSYFKESIRASSARLSNAEISISRKGTKLLPSDNDKFLRYFGTRATVVGIYLHRQGTFCQGKSSLAGLGGRSFQLPV
jgi:hypothetical protein